MQQAVARGATSHMPALVPSVRPHSVVFIAQADGSRVYSPAELRQGKAHPRMSEVAVAQHRNFRELSLARTRTEKAGASFEEATRVFD